VLLLAREARSNQRTTSNRRNLAKPNFSLSHPNLVILPRPREREKEESMNNSRSGRNGGSNGGGTWDRINGLEPWLSVISGGALALYGLGRLLGNKRVSGGMMAAAGGALFYRGVTSERSMEPVHVERGFTIMKPVEEVYRFWRNFENFPRFMSHLDSVVVTGDRWSHWVARGPMGITASWHAEIVDEVPNQHIVWQSKPDSMIETRGSVQFRRHMKQLLEAGEIPTTEGQSHGERSMLSRLANAATSEPRRGGVELEREPVLA
jgi:uncharacterized membrane protein